MSAPTRRFFVIKMPAHRTADGTCFDTRYFNIEHQLWWPSISNATHFASENGARSYCQEFALNRDLFGPLIIIQCISEHTTLDTQIDDDDDPNHGEDWKK